MIHPITTTSILFAAFSSVAFGHGGQYIRPVPRGPLTGVPVTPGGPTTPGRLGGTVGAPTARKGHRVATPSSFATWWRYNGAELEQGVETYVGQHQERPRPTVESDWGPIDDLLRDAFMNDDADIVDSAILAQGRSAQESTQEAAFDRIWPLVAHANDSIRRSAIISLGLVENRKARPALMQLLTVHSKSDQVTQGIAAIALGFLSDPIAKQELMRVVESPAAKDELKIGAIVGLGLYRVDQEIIAAFLLKQLEVKTLSDAVKVRIPIALGRLGLAAIPAVPILLDDCRRGELANRLAAIAGIGRLASPDDDRTISTLSSIARTDQNEVRQGALISLGRIAARSTAALGAKNGDEIRALLRQQVASSSARTPFAAIGLALACGAEGLSREELDPARDALTRAFERGKTVDIQAACAIALGMTHTADAAELLRPYLDPRAHADLAGFVATSLGWVGDDASTRAIRTLYTATVTDNTTREQAARALARIDRGLATRVASRALDGSATVSEATFHARMLGAIGDDTAVPILIRLARDEKRLPIERAFAIVGLGRLLERSPIPWNARLSSDLQLASPSQVELSLIDIF